MIRLASLGIAALLATTPAGAQTAAAPSAPAAGFPDRPTADVARDASRRPAELLAFAGVKAGDKVADFIMGGGYWTALLARAVGPGGKVYAYQPAEFIQFRADYGTEQDRAVAGYTNVVPSRVSLRELSFAEPLDAIITVQNYHDLHLNMAPEGFAGTVAARLFAALKPGGVLVVVDHAAKAGSGFTASDSLHRIDPAAARAEIEAAGFVFEAESSLYANRADPHTGNVFQPPIRGRTDQFTYRFRKPR